jgi:DNA-binding NarL/FixJ family response regulator
MEKVLKVLLVDDHVLFRKGLAALLAAEETVQVVGEAGDGYGAIDLAREQMPDLILMDVHMPGCGGLAAVRAISREMPGIKIIMLTADEEDDVLFESIRSGAHGYLLKLLEPKTLLDMMRSVVQGGVALSPAMMAKILVEFNRPATEADPGLETREELTPREVDVLKQLVGGASNREIAEALSITTSTVKKHLENILAKLHLQNRVQAAVYAVRKGLLQE